MAEWKVINVDKEASGQITGGTYAMKVPGGMIVRTVVQDHGTAMVFVPSKDHVASADVASTWIEDNKVV